MPVEEQTQYNDIVSLFITTPNRAGQELTISDREVVKLGFWLSKLGNPSGDITFTIRKESDDGVLLSKVWGDASALTTTPVYKEVTFDAPVTINELVRILAEFSGGDADNRVYISQQNTDVKADEFNVFYYNSAWYDSVDTDVAYRYTYEEPAETAYNTMVGSPTNWGWQKCDYGAEKCPVGSVPNWAWQAPVSGGPNKTPQGGPLSFAWGNE